MGWKDKVSRLCDKDLMVEMTIDFGSIFIGLHITNFLGYQLLQDGWMSMWMWMIKLANGNAHKMYVFGNLIVLLIVYWVPATIYTVVDIFQPTILYNYKVQPRKAQDDLNWRTLSKVVSTVLSNQIIQTLIGSEIAWRWRYQYINMDMPLEDVPSLNR